MEILGIGPLELLFILLIALIILGPGDMVKAGRTLGRILRKIITSSEYRTIQKASRELRYLPNRLMREASIEDLNKDLKEIKNIGGQLTSEVKKAEMDLTSWTTPPELNDIKADKPTPEETPSTPPDDPISPDKPNNGE
jgi:Sec-independent protein translocase protein TatA